MLHSLWILAATFFTVLTYVFVKWVPPQYEPKSRLMRPRFN